MAEKVIYVVKVASVFFKREYLQLLTDNIHGLKEFGYDYIEGFIDCRKYIEEYYPNRMDIIGTMSKKIYRGNSDIVIYKVNKDDHTFPKLIKHDKGAEILIIIKAKHD